MEKKFPFGDPGKKDHGILRLRCIFGLNSPCDICQIALAVWLRDLIAFCGVFCDKYLESSAASPENRAGVAA